ncbi:cytochrome P450- family 17- subfamily A (steroid 17alpha-monooxygenase) [Apiospora arundinis]
MILRFADSEPNELQCCFANGLLQAQEKETFSNELAALICGILRTAVSDTVAAELSAFVQAMVLPHSGRSWVSCHAATQDDEYDGYRIPKGEMMLLNVCLGHPHGPHPTPESAILRPKPLRAED